MTSTKTLSGIAQWETGTAEAFSLPKRPKQEIEIIIRGLEGHGKSDLAAYLQQYLEGENIEVVQCDQDALGRSVAGRLKSELRHHKITVRTEHTGVAEWLQNRRKEQA